MRAIQMLKLSKSPGAHLIKFIISKKREKAGFDTHQGRLMGKSIFFYDL
jgi:hypothetical protein